MRRESLRTLTRHIPQPVRFGARKLVYSGHAHTCALCGNGLKEFHGHGGGHEVLDRRKVVGGMRREADRCPICHACDRTRLMMLYLDRHGGLAAGRKVRVLHVAPDYGLYLWLKRQTGVDYTGSDIDVTRYRHIDGMVPADLTAIPFDDASFDIVICSHVLEHVPDDRKAMAEILRCLVPGGQALMLVPFATDGQGTDEAPSLTDIDERLRRFGQWDHIRLYDRQDFIDRLERAGFDVALYDPSQSAPDAAEALSLNPLELLPLATRPLKAR